jgi:phenylalanyl-tRNA synthetase alpha chain
MIINQLIAKLHPFERKVLPILKSTTDFPNIVKATKLQNIEVMRALQWLSNKGALTLIIQKSKLVHLKENGSLYKKQGLPEKRLAKALTNKFQAISKIAKSAKLSNDEVNASIGQLKRNKAVDIQKGSKGLELKATIATISFIKSSSPEEKLLSKDFPINHEKLTKNDLQALKNLSKRKDFIEIKEDKIVKIKLTTLGKNLSKQKINPDVTSRLTPNMLKDGSWKKHEFRAYDVEINVPTIHPGKKHFVNQAVDYIKKIWIEMGFQEMSGNYVHSAFWDLDSLFVPQDHPAREMQDTFYIKGKANLPSKNNLYKKIKAVHENGSNTGSTGWGYKYSKSEAEKIMLRTHTTVLSAQTISKLKETDLPAKFFAVNKVFRNEALDWKHLFEFYQVEGIVVDPNANLKHLKGYLTQFYKKMGYTKVRMRPAHFPYTEPSVEVDVFHPVKKEWVELGGAGIFRPEVVKPLLGIDCPVLAWGQGMGRIISSYWNITDIRDLYKNDLKQLREMKLWME